MTVITASMTKQTNLVRIADVRNSRQQKAASELAARKPSASALMKALKKALRPTSLFSFDYQSVGFASDANNTIKLNYYGIDLEIVMATGRERMGAGEWSKAYIITPAVRLSINSSGKMRRLMLYVDLGALERNNELNLDKATENAVSSLNTLSPSQQQGLLNGFIGGNLEDFKVGDDSIIMGMAPTADTSVPAADPAGLPAPVATAPALPAPTVTDPAAVPTVNAPVAAPPPAATQVTIDGNPVAPATPPTMRKRVITPDEEADRVARTKISDGLSQNDTQTVQVADGLIRAIVKSLDEMRKRRKGVKQRAADMLHGIVIRVSYEGFDFNLVLMPRKDWLLQQYRMGNARTDSDNTVIDVSPNIHLSGKTPGQIESIVIVFDNERDTDLYSQAIGWLSPEAGDTRGASLSDEDNVDSVQVAEARRVRQAIIDAYVRNRNTAVSPQGDVVVTPEPNSGAVNFHALVAEYTTKVMRDLYYSLYRGLKERGQLSLSKAIRDLLPYGNAALVKNKDAFSLLMGRKLSARYVIGFDTARSSAYGRTDEKLPKSMVEGRDNRPLDINTKARLALLTPTIIAQGLDYIYNPESPRNRSRKLNAEMMKVWLALRDNAVFQAAMKTAPRGAAKTEVISDVKKAAKPAEKEARKPRKPRTNRQSQATKRTPAKKPASKRKPAAKKKAKGRR